MNDMEANSGIILRAGSRIRQQDELVHLAAGRQYLALESFDDQVKPNVYTVGVVVDRSGVM